MNGQKRYFPVALAEKEIADYNARVATFNGKKTTYDTDKTAYEAYLVKAAVKPDFFTALFAPPAAIAVVVRPNLPVAPEAYTGLYAWGYPTTGYASASIGANAANKVGAGEFVVDGESGGWGSWTMGTLKPVVGGDMEHSFGVFGWAKSTASYKAQEQSFTRNWSDMCFPAAEATNGMCPAPGGTKLTVNSKFNILCISVWAFDYTNAKEWADASSSGVHKSSLTLQFSINKWKQNYAAWKKPATATAPTEAKKPTGAKMIAASAAVATAVAAALF